jgi:hypothetical protein
MGRLFLCSALPSGRRRIISFHPQKADSSAAAAVREFFAHCRMAFRTLRETGRPYGWATALCRRWAALGDFVLQAAGDLLHYQILSCKCAGDLLYDQIFSRQCAGDLLHDRIFSRKCAGDLLYDRIFSRSRQAHPAAHQEIKRILTLYITSNITSNTTSNIISS